VDRSTLEHFCGHQAQERQAGRPRRPSSSEAGYLVGLSKMWERVAPSSSTALHGVRHWFASAATEMGHSDLIIGALFGHANKGIGGRYVTAPDPALVAAADRISRH